MSVITSQNSPAKRRALLALAFLLLLLGGVGLYFGSHNFPIRSLGLAAIMASTYAVRISRGHVRPALPKASGRTIELKTEGPGRALWILSIAFVPLLGAAFLLMDIDSVNGGHEVWPVYLFAGVVFAGVLVWGCLVARIFASRM